MTFPSEWPVQPEDAAADDAAVEAELAPIAPLGQPCPTYDDDPYDVARDRREFWEREDERLEEDR